MNAVSGALRSAITQAAEIINANIAHLAGIEDDEERLCTILSLVLDENELVKVKKSAAKSGSKPRTSKKADDKKKLPVPLWWYDGKTTAKTNLCQGLAPALYNQCTGKLVEGSQYCSKCKKEMEKNDGVHPRGTVSDRYEQFETSKYEYETPLGKKRVIYPFEYYSNSKKYTAADFDTMLEENGIVLNSQQMRAIKYIKPKKNAGETKKKKGKNLTNLTAGMTKPEESDTEDEESDTRSDAGSETDESDRESVVGTEPEDSDTEYAPEEKETKKPVEEEEEVVTPTKKPVEEVVPKKSAMKKPIDITKYKCVKFGDSRICTLRSVQKDDPKFPLFEFTDYTGPGKFTVVSEEPYAYYNALEGEIEEIKESKKGKKTTK